MPWTSIYDPNSDFVEIVYAGTMTADDLAAEENHSIALSIENNTRRFLIDLIDYEGYLSEFDLLDSPSTYEEKLVRLVSIWPLR